MEMLKQIAKTIWMNHRKKAMAFIIGLLFAAIATVSGIPLEEIKDAAKEAANKPAEVVAVPAPVAIPLTPAQPEKAK
jgi:nucleoside permease NupC